MRIAVGWGVEDSLWEGLEEGSSVSFWEGDEGASGFVMLVGILRRKR
jgi:hypothetical protein